MVDPLLLAYPIVAITAASPVLTAFTLKAREKKYYRTHYAVAITAFILTALAFFLGVNAFVTTSSANPFFAWPATLPAHAAMSVISGLLLTVQATLGITMLLRNRPARLYRIHRRLGKFVATAFVIQGSLGLTVLYGII